MPKLIMLVSAVLGFLFVERTVFLSLTRCEGGRQWIRDHKWLHPNAICIYRIPMGILTYVFWYVITPEFASLWFGFWMLTDMTDGTVARGCDLGSPTGEWLDPLSDKLMYIPVLFMFALWKPSSTDLLQPLAMLPVIIFTIIDVVGQASRFFVKKKAANSFGKAKTIMICLLLIVCALKATCPEAYMTVPVFKHFNMDVLMWGCVVLAFLSFYCKVIPDIWYANTLTFMNFVCGCITIYIAFAWGDRYLIHGFVFIFVGQFFDLLDGRAARKFGSTRYGGLMDDLGDGTSFGLAIGALIFVALKPFSFSIALATSLVYVICVIYRLYRFLKYKEQSLPGIFSGMPSPAGAMLAGSATVLYAKSYPWALIAIILVSSALMISRVKYQHFGQRIWFRLPNALKLALFVTIMVYGTLVFRSLDAFRDAFALFCFSLILIYAVIGVDLKAGTKK